MTAEMEEYQTLSRCQKVKKIALKVLPILLLSVIPESLPHHLDHDDDDNDGGDQRAEHDADGWTDLTTVSTKQT